MSDRLPEKGGLWRWFACTRKVLQTSALADPPLCPPLPSIYSFLHISFLKCCPFGASQSFLLWCMEDTLQGMLLAGQSPQRQIGPVMKWHTYYFSLTAIYRAAPVHKRLDEYCKEIITRMETKHNKEVAANFVGSWRQHICRGKQMVICCSLAAVIGPNPPRIFPTCYKCRGGPGWLFLHNCHLFCCIPDRSYLGTYYLVIYLLVGL